MGDIALFDLSEKNKRRYCPVPPPKSLVRNLHWWTLWVPCVVGGIGLFMFNVPGMGFIRLYDFPPNWLNFLVVGGALLMMFGSDVGTVFSIFTISSKYVDGSIKTWDWVGLVVSVFAAVAASTLSFAFQLDKVGVEAGWISQAKMYGPLFAVVFIILDLTMSSAEAGMYLGIHTKSMKDWQEMYFIPWLKEKEQHINWVQYEEPVDDAGINDPPPDWVDKADVSVQQPVIVERNGGMISQNGSGWSVVCKCGWEKPGYITKSRALSGLSAHHRFCDDYKENGGAW